jgi:tetratricopeptide (TPR) repeat protein
LLLVQTHHVKDPKRQQELFDRTRLDLAQAAKFGAHEPDILLALASCWQALNDPDKALDAYAGVLDGQAPLESFRGRRGYQEKQDGLKRLLLFATSVAEDSSKGESALAIKAHAAFALGDDDQALREAERALALRENARARTVRGFINLRRGLLNAAEDDFKKAIDREPSGYLAAAGRARTLELREQWEDALRRYDDLLSLAKTYWQTAEAHLGRARILAKLGRQPQALQAEAAASRLYAAFGDKPATILFR